MKEREGRERERERERDTDAMDERTRELEGKRSERTMKEK